MKHIIKRIPMAALALSLLLSVLPGQALAADTPQEAALSESSETITASGVCGENVTWELDAAGTLTLTGEGAMYDCTDADPAGLWDGHSQQIKTLVVHEGVTSIGSYAFFDCGSLTELELPSTITSIGESAFEQCGGIRSVEIPGGVTAIADRAFYLCGSLAEVTMHQNLTAIGGAAFSYCRALEEIDIPASVTSLGPAVFEGCSALTHVSIPGSLTCIPRHTFAYCGSLTSVVIPDSVTGIGAYAFCDCGALTEVSLGGGVVCLEKGVFQNCSALETIDLPESLTELGDSAFLASGLKSITIPGSVTVIGNHAFERCAELTGITFLGDAPAFLGYASGVSHACYDVTATVRYPAGNSTWTEDKRLSYGGDLTWLAVDGFQIPYASMTMGSSLAINFAFDASAVDDWTGCCAQIVKTYSDGREDVVENVPFEDWKTAVISSAEHYYVTFDGIAAKEMTDTVYVTIRSAQGIALSSTKTDSVRDQSMRALEKDISGAEKTMIVDMLNYGAAAQDYFGYGTEDPANALLSPEQLACASACAQCADSRVSSGSFAASTVVLKSSIQMMFAFTDVDSSMYAVVTFANHRGDVREFTIPADDFSVNGSFRVVTVDALVAADGRQAVTCAVYDADGNEVASVTDSLESYTARNNGSDELFARMMQYSDSACAYFHS